MADSDATIRIIVQDEGTLDASAPPESVTPTPPSAPSQPYQRPQPQPAASQAAARQAPARSFDPYADASQRRESEIRREQINAAYDDLYSTTERTKKTFDTILDVSLKLRGTLGGAFGPLVGSVLDVFAAIRDSAPQARSAQRIEAERRNRELASAPAPPIQRATGGEVPQVSGIGPDEDEVPLRATAGEFVVRKSEATKPENRAVLERMNRGYPSEVADDPRQSQMLDRALYRSSGNLSGRQNWADGGNVTQNENFRKWFGDSKVVDEEGRPKTVYHGATQDFDSFNTNSFFSDDPEIANYFAKSRQENAGEENAAARIIPAYIKMEKPFVIDAKGKAAGEIQFARNDMYGYRSAVKDEKNDGVIIKNTSDEGDVYVPRGATQIKSSIANRGTYDAADPRIHHADGGEVDEYSDAVWKAKTTPKIAEREYVHGDGRKFFYLSAFDPETNDYIGKADFKATDNSLYPLGVSTVKSHRRQGVATALYKYMEDKGFSIVDGDQLPDGKKFRETYNANRAKTETGLASGGNISAHPDVPLAADEVPIKATAGEFIVNKDAAQQPENRQTLEKMNAGLHYDKGGMVPPDVQIVGPASDYKPNVEVVGPKEAKEGPWALEATQRLVLEAISKSIPDGKSAESKGVPAEIFGKLKPVVDTLFPSDSTAPTESKRREIAPELDWPDMMRMPEPASKTASPPDISQAASKLPKSLMEPPSGKVVKPDMPNVSSKVISGGAASDGAMAGMSGALAAAAGPVGLALAVVDAAKGVRDSAMSAVRSVGNFAAAFADPSADAAKTMQTFGEGTKEVADKAFMLSPALGILAGTVGEAASSFGKLMSAINATAERYGEFSPVIAQAQAIAEVNHTLGDVRRAQESGPELARYVQMQGQLQQQFEDIKIKVLLKILPIVTKIGDLVEKIMPSGDGIASAVESLAAPLSALVGIANMLVQTQENANAPPMNDPTSIIFNTPAPNIGPPAPGQGPVPIVPNL